MKAYRAPFFGVGNEGGTGRISMDDTFYALLFRQRHIRRWSLMRGSEEETLSRHSMQTAILAQALALIGNRYFGKSYDADRAASLALYHDAPEVITGDLPTPVKYYSPALRDGYAAIERDAVARLLSKLPEELREDYRALLAPEEEADRDLYVLVKAADKLDAYIKCIEEAKAGNSEFRSAEETLRKSLDAISGRCPELAFFRERFLPAFRGTLDEIS